MRMMVLFLPVFLLASCGDGKADAARELAAQEAAAADNMVDLARFDMPLFVVLPDNEAPEDDTLFGVPRWVEEFGHVEVHAGPHFGITIVEDEGDMARLRSALERDMLRTYTVVEETPELLIYRQKFPDDDLVFVHFYRIVRVQGRTFVVESHNEGRYNEADVAVMSAAVQQAMAL